MLGAFNTPRRRELVRCALTVAFVAVAAWFSYGRMLASYFTDVDTFALIATGRIERVRDVLRILSEPLLFDLMPNARFFRPLTSISYGIDERLWGLKPFGYHLSNWLLHTANACLLCWVVEALRSWFASTHAPKPGRPSLSLAGAFAGILFVIHPSTRDFAPVIARRADLLTLFFGLLTLAALLADLRAPSRRKKALAGLFCLCCLAAKETGALVVPLACSLLLLGGDSARKESTRRVLLPVWLPALIYISWRSLVLRGIGGYAPIVGLTRELAMLRGLEAELLMALAPSRLNALSAALAGRELLPALIVLTILAALAFSLVRTLRAGVSGQRGRIWLLGAAICVLASPIVFGGLSPRQMYLHVAFFSALLGTALFQAAVFLRGAHTTAARARRGVTFAAVLACVALLIYESPLRRQDGILERWRVAADLTHQVVSRSRELAANLPAGSRVLLVNFPYRIHFAEHADGFEQVEVRLLLEHSVQGFFDLALPDRHLEVVALTHLELAAPTQSSFRSAIGFSESRRVLEIHVQGSAVVPFPWPNDFGRHQYEKLFLTQLQRQRGVPTGRAARLLLFPQLLHEPCAFLIFDRHGVHLESVREFSLAS